ncbi:hypothetical protein [Nonomuraea longicatena]|uniref:Uncharacterized protein n=1 Tax=Nonomuraea longicatena TaxID=83682 RepID=A0ABP3Z1I3_9ACTN
MPRRSPKTSATLHGLDVSPPDDEGRIYFVKAERLVRTALSEGPDGRMYAGGFLNGGFAALDPRSGELAEFHTFSQSEKMTTHRGKLYIGAYGGTSIYSGQSATPPTQPEAKLFAWSVRHDRLLWEIVPVPGKPAIPALTFDPSGRLWGIAGGTVFSVDTHRRKVTGTVKLSDSKSSTGQLVFNPKDHRLYGAHAGQQVFSMRLPGGRHTVLREGPVHQLAVHGSGDVYFAEGPKLFRLKAR